MPVAEARFAHNADWYCMFSTANDPIDGPGALGGALGTCMPRERDTSSLHNPQGRPAVSASHALDSLPKQATVSVMPLTPARRPTKKAVVMAAAGGGSGLTTSGASAHGGACTSPAAKAEAALGELLAKLRCGPEPGGQGSGSGSGCIRRALVLGLILVELGKVRACPALRCVYRISCKLWYNAICEP